MIVALIIVVIVVLVVLVVGSVVVVVAAAAAVVVVVGGGGEGGYYDQPGVDAISYGSGGGGAGRDYWHYMPGSGFSGVVVIRYLPSENLLTTYTRQQQEINELNEKLANVLEHLGL